MVVGDFNNDSRLDIVVAYRDINDIALLLGYGNGSFAQKISYITGPSRPLSLAVNDFNNDHRLDIAVVNYGTNSMGVLLGYGNGSFASQTTYLTAFDSLPQAIAVGDFNNDGQLDITVANTGTNKIGVFLGNGNGAFSNQTIYSTGSNSNPMSIAIDDLNNDTRLDIVVANYGTNNIGVFIGNGDGTFAKQVIYSTGLGSHPVSVAIGDFNKDSFLDITVANNGTTEVGVLLGNGDGRFQKVQVYATPSGIFPTMITVTNINNDYWPDIVISIDNTDNIGILLGDGPKSFTNQVTFSAGGGSGPLTLAAGYFNNDTRLDIVIGGGRRQQVAIILGDGNGGFTLPTIYATDTYVTWVAVGDFNQDTNLDMVATLNGVKGIYLFLGNGDGTFSNATKFSTVSTAYFVAVADLNNDTRLDIVVTTNTTDNVRVMLGKGDGTFSGQITYSTYSVSYSVAVGDFNNDNRLDIVVANYGANDIGILLGNGDGTFSNQTLFSTGSNSNPISVASGDFNRDGRLDIVVANFGTNNIGVFIGNGDGTFLNQITYPTGSGSTPNCVTVSDVNTDGRLDIIVANSGGNTAGILLGNGDATFGNQTTYSTGANSYPSAIIVGDFNQDNRLDTAVVNTQHHTVGVFFGYYNSPFTSITTYSTSTVYISYAIASGNFNNDTQLDIVLIFPDTDNIGILLGYGNGTFQSQTLYSTGVGSYPSSVTVADFNNDDRLDIAVANHDTSNIGIYLGFGNGTFGEQTTYSLASLSHPQSITVGDLNNDSRMDVITANYDDDTFGLILFYDNGAFEDEMPYTTRFDCRSYSPAVADFNGDHRLDLILANYYAGNVGVHFGNGDGTFSNETIYLANPKSTPRALAIGDFNNDTIMDVAVGNTGTQNVGVLIGHRDGTFSNQTLYKANSNPYAIAVGDFNNDNQLDIVTGYYFTACIGIYIGLGNGTFSRETTYPAGAGPYCIAVGDFNNDGRLDVVIPNSNDQNIGVLLGNGDGSFANQNIFSTGAGSFPASLAVGDFNNDNRPDIVVADEDTDSVGVFIGYGNGSFAKQITYPASSAPRAVNVGYFNNDTYLDIVVALALSDSIGLLLGFGDGTFTNPTMFATGLSSYPAGIAVANWNDDKWMDVAIVHKTAVNVGIFLGSGDKIFAVQNKYSTGLGSAPQSIAVHDFNKDKRLDVVVTNSGTDNIGVFMGYGDGTFGNQTIYPTGDGSSPWSVAVGDLNNDGLLDIAVANRDSSDIAVFTGYGDGTFGHLQTYSTGPLSVPVSIAVLDFNKDMTLDIAVATSDAGYLGVFQNQNGTFDELKIYRTGYKSNPSAITVGDFNNDNWTDIAVITRGINSIEVLLKKC
jgi:streptogramin lyase